MGLLDRFRKEKPFPEKGEYQGVKYRIDADSVILEMQSGKELSLIPPKDVPPAIFDAQCAEAASGKIKSVRLIPWLNADLEHRIMQEKPGEFVLGTDNGYPSADLGLGLQNAAEYDLTLPQYANLIMLGREIFARHLRSQKLLNRGR